MHVQSMYHNIVAVFDQCIIDSVGLLTVASQIIDLYIKDQRLVIHELTNFQRTDRYDFLFVLVLKSKWISY